MADKNKKERTFTKLNILPKLSESDKVGNMYKLIVYQEDGTIISAIRTNDVTLTSPEGKVLNITDLENANEILINTRGYKVDPKNKTVIPV